MLSVFYSPRSTTVGSTFVACHAGIGMIAELELLQLIEVQRTDKTRAVPLSTTQRGVRKARRMKLVLTLLRFHLCNLRNLWMSSVASIVKKFIRRFSQITQIDFLAKSLLCGTLIMRTPSDITMCLLWRMILKPAFWSALTASRWLMPGISGTTRPLC